MLGVVRLLTTRDDQPSKSVALILAPTPLEIRLQSASLSPWKAAWVCHTDTDPCQIEPSHRMLKLDCLIPVPVRQCGWPSVTMVEIATSTSALDAL